MKPIHILSLSAENILRLTAVHIEPNGNTITLGGQNGEGKSSVLNAIVMALKGPGKISEPIHQGESSGRIELDLGEFKVTRVFTASGDRLTVKSADGAAKYSSPQTMLDGLIGAIAFDPLEFTRKKASEQLNILKELVGINTGMLDAARGAAFDERTAVNRKVKELEAQVAKMPHHPDAPAAELDPNQETQRIREAQQKNHENAKARQAIEAQKNVRQDVLARVVRLRAELAAAEELLSLHEKELEGADAKLAELVDCDLQTIMARSAEIGATNQKVRENVMRADALEALTKHQAHAQELTTKIDNLDAKKRDKIQSAKYPVDGLELGEAGVLFNGLPLEQASSAEAIRVSMAIGLALNPRLRVLIIRDGSLLDENSLAMIARMAEEANAQVWIERVGKGDEVQVVIEDGTVSEVRG